VTLVQGIALAIFVVTFASILLERVHRAIVAMASAVVMVVVGMALGFYSQEEALASIDFNTIGLLLGMMILVYLLEKTGFFQYLAILMAKRSGGNPWLLLVVLSVSTAVLSMLFRSHNAVGVRGDAEQRGWYWLAGGRPPQHPHRVGSRLHLR